MNSSPKEAAQRPLAAPTVARQSLENGDYAAQFSRTQMLGTLKRREAILHAASFVANCFLSGDWESHIAEALERLGQASDVSRVYIFEKTSEVDAIPHFCQRYEWCAPGIDPQINNQELQDFSLESIGLARWAQLMANNQPVISNIASLPAEESATLIPQAILSIAVMPIIIEGEWWGFLGFDECRHERDWDEAEIDALSLTANLIGSGIARGRANRALDESAREMRALFGAMSDVILVVNREGRYLKIAPTSPELLIQPPRELLGKTIQEAIGGETAHKLCEAIAQVLNTGKRSNLIYSLDLQGHEKWFDATISPLDEESAIFVARDVTETHQAQEELRRTAALFHLLTENSIDVIARYTIDLKTLFVSPSVERLLGYPPEHFLDKSPFDTIHPDDATALYQVRDRLLANPNSIETITYRRRHRDGRYLWFESVASTVRDSQGEVVEFHIVTRDVTARKIAEERLKKAEARYRSIFENAVEGIFQTSPEGFYLTANPSLARIYGYDSPAHLISAFSDISSQLYIEPRKRAEFMTEMEKKGEVSGFEAQIRRKDGSVIWISENARAVRDERGQLMYYEGTVEDITGRKNAEDQLIHDALHDRLTGLANRALFTDRLTQAFTRLKRHPSSLFAVLFLDFDRFKHVNDSLGHMAGDQLLIEISARLASCLRPGDTVSRLGGDEFAILIEDVTEVADATQVAERIQQTMGTPFLLDGQDIFSSASIGIALAHSEYEKPEDLLRDADMAMYRAKALGKARHEVFDASLHARAVALLQLETDLRRAIERQEFELWYQPIVNLSAGVITGFEALIRWQHPERGLVPPIDFIPVAEETGWIVPIGRWVLEEACAQLTRWQAETQANPPLTMSVNLSGKQFSQPDLLPSIEALIQQHDIAPGCLKLEITESAIMENAQAVTERLLRLRTMGVRLGLDDFGTGYSSLSYLHRFPLDTLKIDRSFISRMMEGGENREIVRTIVTLGRNLGMDVVAEGVEGIDQLDDLRALDCGHGQGFLFARPLTAEAAFGLLREAPIW